MLTVLSVAYPLARVGPDAVGGAEQVLTQLDRALVQAGHRSIVIARADSDVAGELVPVPKTCGRLTEDAVAAARLRHAAAINEVLGRAAVDVVHMHGIDFHAYLPSPGPAVLATLHGPPSWYPNEALNPARSRTWLNAVSRNQHAALLPNARLLAPVENGVSIDALQARHAKRAFALMLSRVAPEKGVHLALDAARLAGMPLFIAGEVHAFPEHERYAAEDVAPRLDGLRRLIGPANFERKRRLLSAARCVVIASPVPETSSLVAREALAAGTPVVALRRGALVDTIEHGVTGFLVDDVREMADAMLAVGRLDPEACRAVARERFTAERMCASYLDMYQALARTERTACALELAS